MGKVGPDLIMQSEVCVAMGGGRREDREMTIFV